MFSNLFFRFVNISFSWYIFFVCARSLTLTKPFFHLSQPGSCAWLSPFLLCADCTCVLVCVCLYVHVKICGWSWYISSKCKQNRYDVMYSINIENRNRCLWWRKTSSEVASFQTHDRMQYEKVKYNKCVRLPDSGGGSWIVIPSFPALTLYKRVFLSLSHHTCTLCPMFSLDPSVVNLITPCTCWRKDTITRLCALHTCVTWSAKSLSFFLTMWSWVRKDERVPNAITTLFLQRW